jgi:hypothetical protein
MRNNALYYPYINVPTTKWLVETLLYWDKLSSIVPYEFTADKSKLSKRMQELTSAGLVEHILPLDYFSKLESFEKDFLDKAKNWIKANKNISFNTTKIHIEKLGSLHEEFISLGIAKNYNYPWIEIPSPLANYFMSCLATELGKLPEINATPLTNISDDRIIVGNNDINLIRNNILTNIMPIPNGIITIDNILDFKNKYGHLTKKFRDRIEEECIDIIGTDLKYREEKIHLVKKNLNDEINEIKDAMNTSWRDVIFKSIMPLAGTVLTISAEPSQQRIILGTSITIASTVYQGISTWQDINKYKSKPLAYVTLANKKLLSNFS